MAYDYAKNHVRSMYAPVDVPNTNIKKGMHVVCNNDDEEKAARQQGYISAAYVKSFWPKTMYHKTTGKTVATGRLDWTDERNAKAVADLGPDWTEEHVPVPEPVAKSEAPAASGLDGSAVVAILGELQLMKRSMEDGLQELDNRISEIGERVQLLESSAPGQVEEAPKEEKAKAAKGKAKEDAPKE